MTKIPMIFDNQWPCIGRGASRFQVKGPGHLKVLKTMHDHETGNWHLKGLKKSVEAKKPKS